jgi:NAD(P)-dependent dehydrogenase (short-subunit alcohol dehydrogenase family)
VPYLADHVVDDRVIVPGAAYAAMVLDAVSASPWPERSMIEAMELQAAMDVSPPAVRTVQLVVTDRGDRAEFRISSRDHEPAAGPPRWVLHATGVLRAPAAPAARGAADLDAVPAIQARCPAHITGDDHYAATRAWRLAYGPGFAGVTAVWRGQAEAIAAISAPPHDDTGHRLDPRWLDAALQVALALDPRYLDHRAAAAVMPIGWRALRAHEPRPSGALWSHARRATSDGDPSITIADVTVRDASGRVIVEVDGLRLRRLEADDRRVLQIAWRAAEPAEPRVTAAPAAPQARGPWVLVGDGPAVDRVRQRLAGRGHAAAVIDPRTLVDAASADAKLRDAAPHGCLGVVHLAGVTCAGDADPASMMAASEPVWAGALHLVQALARQGFRDVPGLWLVTRGAQAVDAQAVDAQAVDAEAGAQAPGAPGGDAGTLAGTTLLGFGRTLAYEHPELRCTRLDLPAAPSDLDLDALADELLAPGGDDERARRDGRWFTARLASVRLASIARPAARPAIHDPAGHAAPSSPGAPPAGPAIHNDASYLVTGGLGGLGGSLARWLVAHGARYVVLASRSAPTESAHAIARELEASGATIVLAAADVARRADVDRLVRAADQRAPLRGVFHLAGILDDGLVGQQDVARFRRVLAPKLDGAWHLHRATSAHALDHFVVYSSVAALLGSPGQTGYAAANSFLDALVEHRRAAGLPGLSIAWGPIAEIGLAAALERRGERLQDRGMASLAPDAGEAFLAALLGGAATRAGVVSLDVTRWLEFYPALGAGTWFADLIEAARAQARGASSTASVSGASGASSPRLEALRAAPAPLRRGQLEQLVRDQLARVLQCRREAIAPHAPFTAMGLESLTGLELRNRLEVETGLRLPATLIWTRATVAGLAHELHDRLFPDNAHADRPAIQDAAQAAETTDDDLAAELGALLDDIDRRESA